MYLEEMFGLSGKTAIVTGGSRGIGQTVAVGLAKAGADIAIFSRSGADETAKLIEETGRKAKSYLVDVTKENDVDAGLEKVLTDFDSIDVLFNNAGICIHKATFDASVAEWSEVVNVNLTGEFIMCRAVGKIMAQRSIKGSIINMASISGSIVNIPQWQASYNASKAAVIHMTRSLATEWSNLGIRVNSLSPGYIATPMAVDTPQELKDAWIPLIPARRMGKPDELVGAVIYLASDCSTYTNGCDLIVDGAYTCV